MQRDSVAVAGETASATLGESDRIALVDDYLDGRIITMRIARNTFLDLADRELGGPPGVDPSVDPVSIQAAVVPDTSPPGLPPGTRPALDLDKGILSFAFNETIRLADVDMSGAKVLDAGLSEIAALDGLVPAAGQGEYNATVSFTLGRTLRADAVGAARITVPAAAFADVANNSHAALDAVPLDVTADTTHPSAVSRPVLNLDNGTLSVELDEFLGNVRTWTIVLRDESGNRNVYLGGAAVLPPPGGAKYTDEAASG